MAVYSVLIEDIIIAIDGHSGCGKSTTSKFVAEYFNYKYLDSGAMYRAITLYLMRNEISHNETDLIKDKLNDINITFDYVDGHQHTFLNNDNVENEIRGKKISNFVSKYSSISIIREYLVSIQKEIGKGKKIVSMVEKPIQRFFVNAGIYVISPQVFQSVEKNMKIDMPTLLEQHMNERENILMFPIHEYWLDIGRMDDFNRAQADIHTLGLD